MQVLYHDKARWRTTIPLELSARFGSGHGMMTIAVYCPENRVFNALAST